MSIVLYNGHARWKSPTDTSESVVPSPAGLEGFRPRVRYLLLDEGAFDVRRLEELCNPVASLFRLEQAGPDEVLAGWRSLIESLRGPEHRELRRAFVIWFLSTYLPRRLPDVEVPELRKIEEIEVMLVEKAPTWNEIWEKRGLERGLEQGLERGRQQGEAMLLTRQLERRFGPLDVSARQRIEAADADLLLEWGERVLSAEHLEEVFGN